MTSTKSRRVLVLGATGTIGRATVGELVRRGHEVFCCVRGTSALARQDNATALAGAQVRVGDVTDPASFGQDCIRGERFDALVSCLASRTGVPDDAWAIDYQAHVDTLAAATEAGITQVVLLSAICVQKPLLAFQQAKLAFEQHLIDSGLTYSIVRPTAFFKSLSGQIERLKRGKPFLLFGDGELTSCKPISNADLARYLAGCLDTAERHNRILPIGGPGPAITPKQQGEMLFELLGQRPKFRHVPVAMLDMIANTLGLLGRLVPALAEKAELARIGRYYATESMLVLDAETGRYDEAATPSFGSDTLHDHFASVISGETENDRGDHAVF